MDLMNMFGDMPVLSVLAFQEKLLPKPSEDIVNDLLNQVHSLVK
jgi:hypothetical protein